MKKVIKGKNDLATTHPEVAKEAYGWDPNLVLFGNNNRFEWKCESGHIFVASPANRTKKNSKGTRCPFCSGNKVLKGFNDLSTTHPELAKDAYGWDPTCYSQGSDKIDFWICKEGHKYKSAIKNRALGKGCPFCSGRKVLKGFNDLATTHPELAKEAYGWDPTTVVAGSHKKLKWKCDKGHVSEVSPTNRFQGKQVNNKISKCIYCMNQKVLRGFNDLATTHPELAKDADGWDPTTVVAGSNKKLKWKCDKGHTWLASVSSRRQELKSPANCPFCGNYYVWTGFNDLATVYPNIAQEAFGWDPTKVLFGTSKKLKWKCLKNHVWKTSVSARTLSKTKCPSCANFGFDPNLEAYLYFLIHPTWELYQIGISNYPEERLKRHKKNGWDVIEIRGPMEGQVAKEVETSIIKFLKNINSDIASEFPAGKFDGYTESWTIDSFQTNSLKELIDKTREAGY
jgi:hypothetical protein